MRKVHLLFCFLLFSSAGISANLTGRVTDEKGQPVPFVAIYIDGTTQGTTSNVDGYYTLELKPGTYKIDYNLIGYELHSETVAIGTENVNCNVTLKVAGIEVQAVVVYSDKEDPAYAIIRKAIAKRRYYLGQVNAYSCDVYIKGLQRITKHPKKILGQELNLGNMDSSGIIYLSESVSKFNFMQPDKVKEEMISSKVSGNNNAFSYNQASDMLINLYKNNIEITELSERGIISPIAGNALFFYKYHLVGTFQENGRTVDKIEVIPKRRYDPVFRGYIYIVEDGWRIHSADLYLTKDAGVRFVDTLYVGQTFLPVDNATWMVFSNKFKFSFNILGIQGNGVFVGINKNYVLNPSFPKHFFNGEVMKVDTDANRKDSAYWNHTRPVPLTKLEAKNYQKGDSLQKKRESREYLDSLDRKRNRYHFINIFTGYTYYQRYLRQQWYVSPLIESIDFNTVQGLNLSENVVYSKGYKGDKRLSVSILGGYGLSNQKWFGDGYLSYRYNSHNFGVVTVGGGIRPVQYSNLNPITLFINTVYTLLQNQNYLKIYQKNSVFASHYSELTNGLFLLEKVEYADRTPLMNTTDFQLFKIGSRQFTSNNPLEPGNDSVPGFRDSKALTATLQMRIRFKQEYISRPHFKMILDTRYPQLILEYRKAFGLPGLNADYDFVKATVTGGFNFHLLGETSYSISTGNFLTTKNVGFMDFYHFQGNQTIFSNFQMGTFHLLDYYSYSTNGPFVEGHLEHNFEGFLFNKFPLLRKLRLDEIVGVNYLATDALPEYFEVYAGISKLQSIRLDFAMSFMKNSRVSEGLTLHVGL